MHIMITGDIMSEVGKVIDIKGNKVTVELERKEACAKCRACSAGLKSETMVIECYNSCEAAVNERVEIMLEEKSFIAAVLIMYGIPFLSFLVGIGIGLYAAGAVGLGCKELIGFFVGIIFVALSYLWIKSKESYWKSKSFVPTAIRIVKD